MSSSVVRATGFFRDLEEVFAMAASGRVYLLGNGETRVNPVHGADLAVACLDALEAGRDEVNVGGPDVLSWNAIAALAFETVGAPAKITRVPTWVPRLLLPVIRPFNRRAFDVGSFIARGGANDVVAPCQGEHTLRSHYEELARARTS